MRLHSLIIQGFKSFPHRTKIRFSPGISAVVGPNGCGKSNIVDAIRWVLGEQSPSMLRARSMDELIFSGGNGYRAGKAEVRLILSECRVENVPGLEGVDEVEILRRLNGTGEGEYRLNGRRCRRKDILYLFLDTGAGTRGYAIVDQGQVGRFVEMGGDERRLLLEEAAGVARYRARRVEAQKRLEKTASNLERLDDLIAEVRSRAEKVAEQARRAQRYRELRKEADRLAQGLMALEWRELQEQEVELFQELQRSNQRITALQLEMDRLSNQMAAAEVEILQAEEGNQILRRSLSEARERLEGLRRRMAEEEKQEVVLDSRLQQVRQRRRELARLEGQARRRLEELDQEMAERKTAVEALDQEMEQCRGRLEAISQRLGARTKRVEEAKDRLLGITAAHAREESTLRGMIKERERLRQRMERGEERLAALEQELDAALEEQHRIRGEKEEVERVLSRARDGIGSIEEELASVEGQRRAIERELTDLTGRKAAAAAAREALQKMEEEGEGVPEGSRLLLKEGFYPMVAEAVSPAAGWERAVESVLGDSLYAVAFSPDGVFDLDALLMKVPALRLLLKAERTSPLGIPSGDGKRLLDLVSLDDAAKGLEGFLALWLAYDDRDQLIRDHLEGTPAFRVAKDGSMSTPWGELVLRNPEAKSQGVLSRRARIARLEDELQRLESHEMELNSRLVQLKERWAELQGERQEVRREISGLERRLASLEKAYDGELMKSENIRQRMDGLRLELDEHSERWTSIDEDIAVREERLEELAKELTDARDALAEEESKLSGLRELHEGQKAALEELRLGHTALVSELKALQREKERIINRLSSSDDERSRLEWSEKEAGDSLTECRARVERLKRSVEAARAEVEQVNQQQLEAEEALKGLRAGLEGLRKELAEHEERRRKEENRRHQCEVGLARIAEKKKALQETAVEEYRQDISSRWEEWLVPGGDPRELEQRLRGVRRSIKRLMPVNLTAFDEYRELRDRLEFLEAQKGDLEESLADLNQAIRRIDTTCRDKLSEAIEAVNRNLTEIVPLLFDGGSAKLQAEGDLLGGGVDYLVQLPGKRLQHLGLLSGGEKALAALALIFAFFFLRPSPFCLLDEVDAPLDEANTIRFCRLVKRIAQRCQVVLITHNQRVMEIADTLFGVTMEESGVSKLVSVDLVEV